MAHLGGRALNCTLNLGVADFRVTIGGRLQGERHVDGWPEQVLRLTDTLLASLQV